MQSRLVAFLSIALTSTWLTACTSSPNDTTDTTPEPLTITGLPDTDLTPNDDVQLNLEGFPPTDATWASSHPTVATVTQQGILTAHAPGTSTITAHLRTNPNASASLDVTVLPPTDDDDTKDPDDEQNPDDEPTPEPEPEPTTLTLSPTTATLAAGEPLTLHATLTPEHDTPLDWTTTCGTLTTVTPREHRYTAPTTIPEPNDCTVTVTTTLSATTLSTTTLTATTTLTITPGPPDLTTSTVVATPTHLTADGTSTATITVTLEDTYGNPLTTSAGTLTFDPPTLGTIQPVTNHQNGTYTTTYTAGTQAGTTTIQANLDDQPLTPTPTLTLDPVHFTTIAAGFSHSLALDQNGNAWAWGDDFEGQLGNGPSTTTDQPTPVPVDMPDDVTFTHLAAGRHHSLALDTNGNAWAWGWDGYGHLGDGETIQDQDTPVQVDMPDDVTFTHLAAGFSHSLALDASGNAWAWGNHQSGELGAPEFDANQPVPVPVDMPDDVKFTTIVAGSFHSLAIDQNDDVWTWGTDSSGQLGDGGGNTNQPTPVRISTTDDVTFTHLAAGASHSLALDTNDNAWAWGDGTFGQLGNGENGTDRDTPVQVDMPDGISFENLAAGSDYSLALDTQGDAWAWGADVSGQGGTAGPNTESSVPVRVDMPTDVTFTELTTGAYYALAIDGDGNAWAWGNDLWGQLGDAGTNTNQSTPVQVAMP